MLGHHRAGGRIRTGAPAHFARHATPPDRFALLDDDTVLSTLYRPMALEAVVLERLRVEGHHFVAVAPGRHRNGNEDTDKTDHDYCPDQSQTTHHVRAPQ
jgi:hypothetical protein